MSAAMSLQEAFSQGVLTSLDVAFARRCAARFGETRAEVLLLAARASAALRAGHSCLDLDDGELAESGGMTSRAAMVATGESALCDDRLPGPLALRGTRLYVRQFDGLEARVAASLRARAAARPTAPDAAVAARCLDRYFTSSGGEPDWQRLAAATALLRGLTVVSGGPGTGKTWLAARMLALAYDIAREDGLPPPRVAVLAPTGKAAQRLGEALRQQADELALPWLAVVAGQAATIHRQLGGRPRLDGAYRHGRDRPWPFDWVLVDEGSMIDLPLMAAALDATAPHARLVLFGDRRQLSAVGVGSVFADVCAAAAPNRPAAADAAYLTRAGGAEIAAAVDIGALTGVAVELQRSRRFDDRRGIGQMAATLRALEALPEAQAVALAREAVAELASGDGADVALLEPERRTRQGKSRAAADAGQNADVAFVHDPWTPTAAERVVAGYRHYLERHDPVEALAAFARYRVLAALREGAFGTQALNADIERLLADPTRLGARALQPEGGHYHGRPVMITENDYEIGAFNGDVGIVLSDPETGALRAHFDARPGAPLGLALLPRHETAFALTVHKSQGSEFDEVCVVLPPAAGAKRGAQRLLSRELLYTAITRARERVVLVADRATLVDAMLRRVRKASGLTERLTDDG